MEVLFSLRIKSYLIVYKELFFHFLISDKKVVKKSKIFFLILEIFETNILLLFCC